MLQRLIRTDLALTARLAIPPRARVLRLLALGTAHSGDSPLWLIVSAVALLHGSPFWQNVGERVLAGTLVAGAAAALLKWLFRRQRPEGRGFGLYSRHDRHSFPSGHAARSACIAVLLIPLLTGRDVLLVWLWVGVVGLARVALQVHFVTDVAGGWVTGLLAAMALGRVL